MNVLDAVNTPPGQLWTDPLQEDAPVEKRRETHIAATDGDTVTISEAAREKLKADETNPAETEAGSEESQKNAAGSPGGLTKVEEAPKDGTAEQIALLQKQIKEVTERLAKANEKLAEAQAGQERANPDEPLQDVESPEVKAAQMEVNQLNNQLMQLNQQLQEAMGKGGGGGGSGGGLIQGTRASAPSGSGGVPGSRGPLDVGDITGHIG